MSLPRCPTCWTNHGQDQLCDVLLRLSDGDLTGLGWGRLESSCPPIAQPSLCPAPYSTLSLLWPPPPAPTYQTSNHEWEGFPMATAPFDASLVGAPLFDIYTDVPTGCSPAPSLPDGRCNFVDLTPGTGGAQCGCRRFWSRASAAGPRSLADAMTNNDQTVFCMCSHHACFHDDHSASKVSPADFLPVLEAEKPKMLREPLSPLQDLSFGLTSGQPEHEPDTGAALPAITGASLPFPSQADDTAPPGGPATPRRESSLPDTLSWGDGGLSPQPPPTVSTGVLPASALPPIPPQCLIPSQTSSIASSRYLRPFAGQGLQTLSGARSNNKSRLPLQERTSETPSSSSRLQPLDDDTPRKSGTALAPRVTSPSASQATQALELAPRFSGPTQGDFRNLSDAVAGHEQRLDRLENCSFSTAGHEDCAEKHDHTDLRVTELESRVEEVERLLNDNNSIAGSRVHRAGDPDASTASVVSTSSNATVRGVHSSEVLDQLQALRSQVSQLQSLMPSRASPWEVEVVFLPFPLKRIWQQAGDFKADDVTASEGWTQMPNSNSATTGRAQSPFGGEWTTLDHEREQLLPKAFGAHGLIDKRLRSRGFVRMVSVKGPDARSVQVAINAAFGTLLRDIGAYSSKRRSRSQDATHGRFLGLRQEWVPLRKVHKHSRLRFLDPGDLLSPAMWDVPFLSSVMMRSSEPRLFVTQPDAYLQDRFSFEYGWTWQGVRELSRVYPDAGLGERTVPEADALEGYWTWNDHLDEAHGNPQSSPIDLQDWQSQASSPSQQFFTGLEHAPHSTFSNTRLSSDKSLLQANRPLHIRTTSMPPSIPPPAFSPHSASRRVVSHGQGVPSSHHSRNPVMASAIMKNRRTSSPSRARYTPRWSTSSPSPLSPAMAPPPSDRGQVGRQTTPYYATPYSNAPGPDVQPPNESHTPYQTTPQLGSGSSMLRRNRQPLESSDDEDADMEPYSSTSTVAYDEENDSQSSCEIVTHLTTSHQHAQQYTLPEDEPWPGIEDQMSDGENIDPMEAEAHSDNASNESSQPSEYPSTQHGWNVLGSDAGAGFHIHEDDEDMMP